MRISEEKVMVTMFAQESLNIKIENMMITEPQKIDFQTQMQKVLKLRLRPFCNVLYNGGNFNTASTLVSESNTKEKTGRLVYIVAYPNIRKPL